MDPTPILNKIKEMTESLKEILKPVEEDME